MHNLGKKILKSGKTATLSLGLVYRVTVNNKSTDPKTFYHKTCDLDVEVRGGILYVVGNSAMNGEIITGEVIDLLEEKGFNCSEL